MLRSVSIHNFVHFTEPQRMIFEPGVNFIIGPNSSGKTAIFEMIRRCLSSEINTTSSSVADKKQLAYAVCDFNILSDKNEFTDNHPIKGTLLKTFPSSVVTCLFVERLDDYSKKINYYKVFGALYEDFLDIHILKYDVSYDCFVNDLSNDNALFSKKTNIPKSVDLFNNFISITSKSDNIHKTIQVIFQKIKSCSFDKLTDSLINETFSWLTKSFLGVLPMRSLGPLQWTRSITFKSEEEKKKDYETACQRAQILMHLLSDEKKDSVNWKLEEVFQTRLVYPYKFVKKGDEIQVYDESMPGNEPIPLLKAPDGIVEAKQLSLLISEKKTFTLTIEEPDRGMHPQMISKMRDLLLENVRNKTVLVISHQSAVVSHTTLDRLYVSSKKFDSGRLSHFIQKFPNKDEYKRYGTLEEMKNLLFAERVLFVEGFTDQMILEAVFDVLAYHPDQYEGGVGGLIDLNFLKEEHFRKYVSSIQIIDLREGWNAGPKKMEFCKSIGKDSFVIYDFDVVRKSKEVESDNVDEELHEEAPFVHSLIGTSVDTKITVRREHDNESTSEIDNIIPCKEIKLSAEIKESVENVTMNVSYDDNFKTERKFTTGKHRGWKEDIVTKTDKFLCGIVGVLERKDVVSSLKAVPNPLEINGHHVNVKFEKTYDSENLFKQNLDAVKEFENECSSKNVFVWIAGSIENVINTADSSDEFKKKHGLPIKNFKNWKGRLIKKPQEYFVEIAAMLITSSSEMHRFFRFLRNKHKNE